MNYSISKTVWYTVNEAAKYIRYSSRHIRRLMADNLLNYYKLPNGGVRLHKSDLDAYVILGIPFKKLTRPQKDVIYGTRD